MHLMVTVKQLTLVQTKAGVEALLLLLLQEVCLAEAGDRKES